MSPVVLRAVLAGALTLWLWVTGAYADPLAPPSAPPDMLPGLESGAVPPAHSLTFRIGQRQPADSAGTGNGTGLQTYDSGITWRGAGRFALGLQAQVFDDATERAVLGRTSNLTFGGLEFSAQHALADGPDLYAKVIGSVGVFRFDQNGGPAETFSAASLRLPVTYRLGSGFDVTGMLGYAWFPDDLAGGPGLGARGLVGVGIGYDIDGRTYLHASATALIGGNDTGPEGPGRDVIWTAGIRHWLTPQLAASLYVGTGQANTGLGGAMAFLASSDEAIIGVELAYRPSPRGAPAPRFRAGPASADRTLRFGDGITLPGAATIGTGGLRVGLSGTGDGGALSLSAAPDPDIQLDLVVERFALAAGTPYFARPAEDTRYMLGGRWQALSQGEGDPFSLGVQVLLGRDIEKPTRGVAFASLTAERALTPRTTLRANLRGAAFQRDHLAGVGIGIEQDLGRDIRAMAEISAMSEGPAIWALGARRMLGERGALDIYVTNAVGRHGVGTLLAGETRLGVGVSWQTGGARF